MMGTLGLKFPGMRWACASDINGYLTMWWSSWLKWEFTVLTIRPGTELGAIFWESLHVKDCA